VFLTFEYIRGAGTVTGDSHPASAIEIKDHYPVSLIEGPDIAFWDNGNDSEPKQTISHFFSAASFASFGGASALHIHVFQDGYFNSASLGGFGAHQLKCYDCYISYIYAD
jgi:hypothetical protein